MKEQHLLETARALSFQMQAPNHVRVDAISMACFMINRIPSFVLNDQILYHIYFQQNLCPIELKIFGCTCFVQDVHPNQTKLDLKSLKYIFLSYFCVQKRYICYCPSSNKYLLCYDDTFFQDKPFISSLPSMRQVEDDDLFIYILVSPTPSPDSYPSKSVPPRPSTR